VIGNDLTKLEYIKTMIKLFLKRRGLSLNEEKTKIFQIFEGFDFVGFNFRKYKTTTSKYKEIMLVKPTIKSKNRLVNEIKKVFKLETSFKGLIERLNPILRG